MKFAVLCFPFIVLLSGCAAPLQPNQARVDFQSEPRGAAISYYTVDWGTTPTARVWTFSNDRPISPMVTATWPNGVSVNQTLSISKGTVQDVVFKMPKGAVEKKQCSSYGFNEGTDAFAACVQREVHAANAAKAAKSAADGLIVCTSNRIGNTVNTTCY